MADFIERVAAFDEMPLAVVVGCGDMGMGTARALGRRHPLLVVDIDLERLDQAVRALRTEGYVVSGFRCDIADPDQVAALGASLAAGPGVRVLAHVAAIGSASCSWRQVMQVDLVGVHLVVRALEPSFVRGAVAVLISSTGSYLCPRDPELDRLLDEPLRPDFLDALVARLGHEPDFLEAYFMAKQGVNRLAQTLAVAWGEREIRVLSVSPGLIDSTMGRTGGAALPVYDAAETERRLGSRSEKARKEVPLGRQGRLPEVVAAIDFAASDAASFLSGIDIPVDGGSTAKWRLAGLSDR
jgi:NAD(P)-dependent dehydrogenase (short-subunit alcohol dehydrogenase family)